MPGRLLWLLAAVLLVAGCGILGGKPGGTGGQSTAAIRCGITHTAAGVAVEIEIESGSVACPVALTVEREYAHALASGKVPGNGGGAPASVLGWVCQGFATPEVLATGQASMCKKGTARILAVLAMPATATSSP